MSRSHIYSSADLLLLRKCETSQDYVAWKHRIRLNKRYDVLYYILRGCLYCLMLPDIVLQTP